MVYPDWRIWIMMWERYDAKYDMRILSQFPHSVQPPQKLTSHCVNYKNFSSALNPPLLKSRKDTTATDFREFTSDTLVQLESPKS